MEKRELAVLIIEKFEDFLDEKGIVIPNKEKEEDDIASNIYGSDYYKLEDEIIELLKENNNEERFENFKSYYEYHYQKLLDKITDLNYDILVEKDRRLLSFLKQDLEEIFEIGE